jgi:hypothetical protein
MKAYLKNGQKIKVTQKMANEIAEMKLKQIEDPDAEDFFITRNILGNLFSFIHINEIIAIR